MLARSAARALRYQKSPCALTAPRMQAIYINASSRKSLRYPLQEHNVLYGFRRRIDTTTTSHRTLFTESIPAILVPPVVFVGLLLALWTWKCTMMVVFQDKIIYMPSMPPFARSEKIEEYAAQCKPVQWEEKRIKSLDGTKIALCIGKIPDESVLVEMRAKEVVICYFQGNGSSLPPRLPILSSVLKSIHARSIASDMPARCTIVALSYRGYWSSSGRATQSGIELDAQALLGYVKTHFPNARETVLWGQSIGASIAVAAAATYVSLDDQSKPKISALVLETPFSSIRNMLVALYPQKWLPYRYLWPFLWNQWDSEAALRKIASSPVTPKVLLLPATRDEVVPAEEADKLETILSELEYDFERRNVVGALHTEATVRKDGQESIVKFVVDISKSKPVT